MASIDMTLGEVLIKYEEKVSLEEIEAIRSIEVDAIMCDWKVRFSGGSMGGGRTHLNINFHKPKAHYTIMGADAEITQYAVSNLSIEAVIARMMNRSERAKGTDKLFVGTRIECIEYFRKTLL